MLIEKLSAHSGVPEERLLYLAASASHRYKCFKIPKKKGGSRQIEQPSRAIKAIQRWIVNELILKFPVNQAATAYRKGSSILQNADIHRKSAFTLRADFVDFFHSFSSESISNFLLECSKEAMIELSKDDIEFVANVSTRHGCLTIGAPSSPSITNAMMYRFDKSLVRYADEHNLIYSRYADDIFVSSFRSNCLSEVLADIIKFVDHYPYANLKLNHKKSAYLSRKYKRSITGLVITPDGKLSIGRGRKRMIKAQIHKFRLGKLTSEEMGELRGLLAFTNGVEPGFLISLARKYGEEVMNGISMRSHQFDKLIQKERDH